MQLAEIQIVKNSNESLELEIVKLLGQIDNNKNQLEEKDHLHNQELKKLQNDIEQEY